MYLSDSVMNSVSLRVCGSQLTIDRYIVHVRWCVASVWTRRAHVSHARPIATMTDATVDGLERLFRSSEGVVARALECTRFDPEAYAHRPGAVPRECIFADDSERDDNVTVLSSYTDMVAASWLRHDMPRQVITGYHGVGLLLSSSASRGLASARDLGWSTQESFERGRRSHQGQATFCAGTAASLGRSMTVAAIESCEAAATFAEANSVFHEDYYDTQACAWSDWDQMALTSRIFRAEEWRDAYMTTACVANTRWDLRCTYNQVFARFEPEDVAAIYVKASLTEGQLPFSIGVARAVHASFQREAGSSGAHVPPLVMLNDSCTTSDASAHLLLPFVVSPPASAPSSVGQPSLSQPPPPPSQQPSSPWTAPTPAPNPPLLSPPSASAELLDPGSLRLLIGGSLVVGVTLWFYCCAKADALRRRRRPGRDAPRRTSQLGVAMSDVAPPCASASANDAPASRRYGRLFDDRRVQVVRTAEHGVQVVRTPKRADPVA